MTSLRATHPPPPLDIPPSSAPARTHQGKSKPEYAPIIPPPTVGGPGKKTITQTYLPEESPLGDGTRQYVMTYNSMASRVVLIILFNLARDVHYLHEQPKGSLMYRHYTCSASAVAFAMFEHARKQLVILTASSDANSNNNMG